MYLRHLIVLSALVGLCSAHANPVLLNDNFNGSAVNGAEWETTVPFSDSSVTVSAGSLKLANGAGILSTGDYETPIEILFSFAFLGNTHDSFRLYTRVDDFRDTGYHVSHGVGVSFRIQEDTGNLFGNVALEDSTGVLTTGTFALSSNTYYTGRLVDTGSSFAFYWGADLNPFLTATSAEHYGDKIAAWNREGAGNGSSISAGSKMGLDYVAVLDLGDPVPPQNVPEGGVTVAYAALAMAGLMVARRRRVAS